MADNIKKPKLMSFSGLIMNLWQKERPAIFVVVRVKKKITDDKLFKISDKFLAFKIQQVTEGIIQNFTMFKINQFKKWNLINYIWKK